MVSGKTLGWLIAQLAVGSKRIVAMAEVLDADAALPERPQQFTVEALVAEAAMKALDVAIFQRPVESRPEECLCSSSAMTWAPSKMITATASILIRATTDVAKEP